MWMSKMSRRAENAPDYAQMGTVTMEGDSTGVYLSGERRNVPVFGPGGYCWTPTRDQKVLVLKTGGEGEEPLVAGTPGVKRIAPGEVLLFSADESASIHLHNDGEVEIRGSSVTINGILLDLDRLVAR